MNYRIWMIAVAAGLCGGVAEMAWIGIYSLGSSVSAAAVASQIAATVFPGSEGAWVAPLTGVGIHLALSAGLGVAFVAALLAFRRLPAARLQDERALALVVLSAVWAVNFLCILPAINPAFVQLMPYSVTLASKILFGLAMAGVLHYHSGLGAAERTLFLRDRRLDHPFQG